MQVNIKIGFALQVLSYGTVSPLLQGKMKQTAERYSLRIKIPFLQASGGQGSGMQQSGSYGSGMRSGTYGSGSPTGQSQSMPERRAGSANSPPTGS